ncbi:MAG: VCBS repeat-containing protein, partial [Planctomycetes bacterium]|nr:VCBS repeat-containing protein [Planctomycetota bacterium]
MRPSNVRWLTFGLAFILAACDSQSRVEFTVPRDGQRDVDPRTVIAIRLSSTMTSMDENNTDSRNIIVTGDQTDGAYSGTIVKAYHEQVFDGQTVEQYRQGSPSAGAPDESDEDASEEEDGEDTLVFLLDDNVRFKAGEIVDVFIRQSITVNGASMNSNKQFQFTVTGGSSLAEGDLYVASNAPPNESSVVGLAPTMTAVFSEAVKASTLDGSITVRGQHSGYHPGGITLYDTAAASITQVSQRLATDDSFLPGELVTVTWTSAILSTGDVALAPYGLRFQVRPGHILGLDQGGEGWREIEIARAGDEIAAIVAADFQPDVAGAEFVAVLPRRLLFFAQNDQGAWTHRDTDIAAEGDVKGAVSVDTDDDGIPELLVLLEKDEQGILQRYEVSDVGTLQAVDDPLVFAAARIAGFWKADLDSNGRDDLVLIHDDIVFTPEPAAEGIEPEPENTGYITILELVQGTPDMSNLDLSDPGSLLAYAYQRLGRNIVGFEKSSRLELADLDGDGRQDLISETAEDLVLYRNQSTTSDPFRFRRAGVLSGPEGEAFVPDAWVVLDADRDGDMDLITWKGGASFFHENRQPPRGGDEESTSEDEARGILFEDIPPVPAATRIDAQAGDRVIASNFDGDPDGTPDLIAIAGSGDVHVAIGSPDMIFGFEVPRTFPGGTAGGWALGDFNGDTALDLLVADGKLLRAILSASENVDPVVLPELSRYRPELTVESSGDVAVVVYGDMKDRFAGYSLALDYDETLLEYLGFEIPEFFLRTATFELCPTKQLLGCSGTANARMTYQSGTVGAPTDDVLLGAFRFRPKAVTEIRETQIVFQDNQAGEQLFTNSVQVSEAGVTREVAVADVGSPLELILEPPPPDPGPLLAMECAVLERLEKSYRVLVSWDSPRGYPFDRVVITVAGDPIAAGPLAFGLNAFEIQDDHTGEVTITVIALESGQSADDIPDTAPRESCSLVSIFQPVVTCEPRETSNVIRWTLEEHEVDSFNVYRNGVRIATVSGAGDYVYEDKFPSSGGADIYDVAGVIGSVEGPSGSCRGRDPEPCVTLDPVPLSAALVARSTPSSPNILRFQWRNGEAYDRLMATLTYRSSLPGSTDEVLLDADLPSGSDVEYLYEGDRDRGGAMPGTYRWVLQGFVLDDSCAASPGGVASQPVSFPAVNVVLPDISKINLTCLREGLTAISAQWLAPWRGYDDFARLEVFHRLGDQPPQPGETPDDTVELLTSDTKYRIDGIGGSLGLEPFGRYYVSYIATFAGVEYRTTCGAVSFDPAITTGVVEAGAGLDGFDIPIIAQGVLARVSGVELDLEFPSSIEILGFTSTEAGTGRRRIHIGPLGILADPDPDGDRQSTGEVELLRLRARIAPAITDPFSLVRRDPYPLTISTASIRFDGYSEYRAIAAEAGSLFFRGRYVVLDQAEVAAGSTESVRVAVRATFTAPPGAPDYKFNAFQLHLLFNPQHLELMPVRREDQVGTAIGSEGFFILPTEETRVKINEQGSLKVAWLGFDFSNPTVPAFLEPIVDEEIFVFYFRSRLGASASQIFSEISFVTDATADQPTAFFPVEDVPGVPDMEAFLPGGILITSDAVDLGVTAVEPSRGALTGGNRAVLYGRGFPASSGNGLAIRFISPTGVEAAVDPATIVLKSSGEMSFAVPDSGLRASTFSGARLYGIRLETAASSATLAQAYAYESPAIQSTDVTSVRAFGSDLLRVAGTGLSVNAAAEFLVDGFSDPFPAQMLQVSSDGTYLVLIASGLPGPEGGEPYREARLRI